MKSTSIMKGGGASRTKVQKEDSSFLPNPLEKVGLSDSDSDSSTESDSEHNPTTPKPQAVSRKRPSLSLNHLLCSMNNYNWMCNPFNAFTEKGNAFKGEHADICTYITVSGVALKESPLKLHSIMLTKSSHFLQVKFRNGLADANKWNIDGKNEMAVRCFLTGFYCDHIYDRLARNVPRFNVEVDFFVDLVKLTSQHEMPEQLSKILTCIQRTIYKKGVDEDDHVFVFDLFIELLPFFDMYVFGVAYNSERKVLKRKNRKWVCLAKSFLDHFLNGFLFYACAEDFQEIFHDTSRLVMLLKQYERRCLTSCRNRIRAPSFDCLIIFIIRVIHEQETENASFLSKRFREMVQIIIPIPILDGEFLLHEIDHAIIAKALKKTIDHKAIYNIYKFAEESSDIISMNLRLEMYKLLAQLSWLYNHDPSSEKTELLEQPRSKRAKTSVNDDDI